MPRAKAIVAAERIESRILLIRSHKVILDSDLAQLYGVATKRLNEQVKRNKERFPSDFMFQLTAREALTLRSQIATSNRGHGGRRYQPYAFTEHGAIMAASVLNSHRARATLLCQHVDWSKSQLRRSYDDVGGNRPTG